MDITCMFELILDELAGGASDAIIDTFEVFTHPVDICEVHPEGEP